LTARPRCFHAEETAKGNAGLAAAVDLSTISPSPADTLLDVIRGLRTFASRGRW
jgi:hypothetical protein